MKTSTTRGRPVIVCVDDDEQLLETIEFLLVKNFPSYRIVACVGGQDALEQLTEARAAGWDVQLVLSDQVMPDLSGIELLSRVIDYYPETVRIILTGQAGLQSAIDAIKIGIDDYLEKPLSEMELVKTLRNHLNNYMLRLENQRLQQLIKQSWVRISEVTDLAFNAFNTQLTRLLSQPSQRQEAIEGIRRARANLLQLSWIYRIHQAVESGGGRDPFEPEEVVMEAASCLKPDPSTDLLALRKQQLKLTNFEEGTMLHLHRTALRVALEKLIDNASRHSPVGSTLQITLRGRRFDRTHERARLQLSPEVGELIGRGYCVFTLRDEGTPTEEDVQNLSFVQTWDPSRRSGLKGLGLVIAQEYTLLLDGRLIVDAQAGRAGTEVHLAVPTGSPE